MPLPSIPMKNADKADTMKDSAIINKELTSREKYEKKFAGY